MTSIAIDRNDGLSSAVAIKGPVRCATTANITLSGLQTIDGISVATGDRVLVKNQTDAVQNGIYVADTGPWRRARDFEGNRDVRRGTQVFVTDGTANEATTWNCVVASGPVVIGTTSITFVQHYLNETVLVVATRTALAALDPRDYNLVFLSENGREGFFEGSVTNLATAVAADTQQGVYIASTAVASTTAAWVRVRPKRTLDLQWFGADTSSSDNQPAFAGAVAVAKFDGGATISVAAFYRVQAQCVIDGSVGINLQGTNRESGFYRLTTSGPILKISGSRHTVNDLLFSSGIYTTTASDIVVHFEDAVQCYMERCKIQGGYYPFVVSGGNCTDNTFINNTYTFGMGPAQVIVFDSTAGSNGAHHFYRCTVNQGWPVLSPSLSSALYKGARANSTAYAVNEIVTIGSYTWQCRVAGTSGGSAPTTTGIWYGTDLSDGATLKWRLVGWTNFTGFTFDTNTHYNTVRECDITGPYLYGIAFYNSFAGDPPNDIQIETCTIHGPKQIGIYANAGRNITIKNLNTWNPSDNLASNRYGIFWQGDSLLQVEGGIIYSYTDGVYCGSNGVTITGAAIGNATRGIAIAANINDVTVVGNRFGSIPGFGAVACTNAVNILSGTSANIVVVGNNMRGVTNAINNSSSSPLNSFGLN